MKLQFLAYDGDVPISPAGLTSILIRKRYKKTSKSGFYIESSDSNTVRGRFIRKVKRERTIQDPVAGSASFTEIYFENIQFIFYAEAKLICIIDAPRSSRFFHATLESVFGIGFTLQSLELDMILAINLLSEQFICRVREIHLKDMIIAPNVWATVIAKGTAGVMEAIDKMKNSKDAVTTKVKIDVLDARNEHQLMMRRNMSFLYHAESQHLFEKLVLRIVIGCLREDKLSPGSVPNNRH